MDKQTCGHCGEYGFQDGYTGQSVCRISGCIDANECSDEMKAEMKGKGKDYIMRIFQNKERGINQVEDEQKARVHEEKEKMRIAQEKMAADELTVKELKERAVKLGLPETATKEEVEAKEKELTPPKKEDEKKEEVPENKCPQCGQVIIAKVEEKKEEKPEEKKEEKPPVTEVIPPKEEVKEVKPEITPGA